MQVSVIVPIYNIEAYLQETLQSIAAQKGVSFEVLLIDDGSTDGSGKIAGQFARNDTRFRYIPQKNQGVSAARNAGIALARGEYIAFCDGDDLLPGGSLKALYDAARKGNADLVVGYMYEAGTGEVVLYKATRRLGKKQVISQADTDLLWTFMISGKLYRRVFLLEQEIMFPPLRYSEDAVFFMHCVYTAKHICGCSHPAYYYRKRSAEQESSVTQRCSRQLWEDFIQAHREVEDLYRQYLKVKLSEKQQKIYENAVYQKTAESILGAFYRQYWNCDSKLRDDIFTVFCRYLGKMHPKSRKWLLEKNRDLFESESESDEQAVKPLLTIWIQAGIFPGGEQEAARKLPLMLKSVYSQKFVAFQVAVSEVYRAFVPEVYGSMPNLRFSESMDDISTEYVLVMDRAVFFSSNALLWAWNSLNHNPGMQCVVSCSPGRKYNTLSLKLCANPYFNFCIRLWCKLQEKLPMLLGKRSIRVCRMDSPDRRGAGRWKKNTGKTGISGNSGFRVLPF